MIGDFEFIANSEIGYFDKLHLVQDCFRIFSSIDFGKLQASEIDLVQPLQESEVNRVLMNRWAERLSGNEIQGRREM